MKNKGFNIVVLLSLLSTLYANSQDTSDFATWTSAEFKYDISKKWKVGFEGQLRLKDNSSIVDSYFGELQSSYELFDNFEMGGGLRFSRKNDNIGKNQGYENRLRFNIDAKYKHKINALELKYRLRYQNRDNLDQKNDFGDFYKQSLRFKLGSEYKIKNWKLDPIVSAELFYRIEDGKNDEFSKYRITMGSNYKINKKNQLGIFYRFEQTLNLSTQFILNVLMIKYEFSIN